MLSNEVRYKRTNIVFKQRKENRFGGMVKGINGTIDFVRDDGKVLEMDWW